MMTNLTQRQIDRLDDYEYSLFLAYGDAYKPTPTVSSRTRSDQLWEAEHQCCRLSYIRGQR